ncbi:hypothetical protein GCM10010123_38380 [Pilimelia anulata]|uniref:Uncharacterized protein n=1 Tax=Pilimelia anulata TaxID=53371 RepID=A0A8J3BEI5_9ACTN|nr:hypothetical protein [Pilimelia anulata]GGK04752.1 hypothetical protein GCM10010123_38380 [Pilimelia anulata]
MRYWPFAVGRTRTHGYRLLAVPDVVRGTPDAARLGVLPGPPAAADPAAAGGPVLRCRWRSTGRRFTVLYRTLAPGGDPAGGAAAPYRDEHGRPVTLTVGVLLVGRVRAIRAVAADLLRPAETAMTEVFARAWAADRAAPPVATPAGGVPPPRRPTPATPPIRILDLEAPTVGRTDNIGRRRLIAAGAAVAVSATIGLAVWQLVPTECDGYFFGMAKSPDGECIGVISAARQLRPDLRPLYEEVEAANRGTEGGPAATVVVLTPLSVATDGDADARSSAMVPAQLRESLQGVLVAQQRANSSTVFGDPAVRRIRLVLANQGARQEFTRELVDEILTAGEDGGPPAAVVGFGSSYAGTVETARALSDKGIPMVVAVASADNLNGRAIPGLHSVSPSNTQLVRALRKLFDARPAAIVTTQPLQSALLVADSNKNDPYVDTVRAAFETEFSSRFIKFPLRTFVGSTMDTPLTPGVFGPLVSDICNAVNDTRTPARLVFFAGRAPDFEIFAEKMSDRVCRSTPLVVLVAATGFQAGDRYRDMLRRANLALLEATSTDHEQWSAARPGSAGAPDDYPEFAAGWRARRYPEADLVDGYAMMYHDALATAARAIRLAPGTTQPVVPGDVGVQLNNLTLGSAVRGATGRLEFSAGGDGRAGKKWIVIKQLDDRKLLRVRADYVVPQTG